MRTLAKQIALIIALISTTPVLCHSLPNADIINTNEAENRKKLVNALRKQSELLLNNFPIEVHKG